MNSESSNNQEVRNKNVRSNEKPFNGFGEGFLWFFLPALFLGYCIQYLFSANENKDSQLPFASWLAETSNLAVALQFLLIVFAVHFFTTIINRRLLSVFFALVIGCICLLLQLILIEQFTYEPNSGLNRADEGWVLALSIVSSTVIVIISMPFFRTITHRKQRFNHYPSLFEYAWSQSVVFLLAGLFVGVVFLILVAAIALFNTIDVDLAKVIFNDRVNPFLQCGAFASGVAISRQFETLIHSLVELIASLFRALLTLHLFLVLVFLGFIAVKGFSAFDDVIEVKVIILTTVAIGLTLSTSAVGYIEASIPRWLSVSWRGMSIAALSLSGLALWLVSIRIQNYGVTHMYLLLTIFVLVGLFHSLGYAMSAVIPKFGRYGVQQTNVFGALIVLVLAIFIQTPMGDLVKYSVDSQVARIKIEGSPVAPWRLRWLQRESGTLGEKALDSLYADSSIDIPDRSEIARYTKSYVKDPSQALRLTFVEKFEKANKAGTLKINSEELEKNEQMLLNMRRILHDDRIFRTYCLDQGNDCRVFLSTEFVSDELHAMVLIRRSAFTANIDWYKIHDSSIWKRLNSYNFKDAYTISQFTEEGLDRTIELIDKGELNISPVEINAVIIDGQSLYPPAQ